MSMDHLSYLILTYLSIETILNLEYPSTSEYLLIRRQVRKFPSLILNQRIILTFDCFLLMDSVWRGKGDFIGLRLLDFSQT